jgi:hypothetical protein
MGEQVTGERGEKEDLLSHNVALLLEIEALKAAGAQRACCCCLYLLLLLLLTGDQCALCATALLERTLCVSAM